MSKKTSRNTANRQKETQTKKHSITNSVKKVEGMDFPIWMTVTIIYVVFVALLSGIVKTWLPEIIYLGVIPIDPQYGVFAFMIALWIPISLLLKALLVRY